MRRSARRLVSSVGLCAVATGGHLLYPAWLAATTRGRRENAPPERPVWPPLLVVIPAYREQDLIVEKVADLGANAYPGPMRVVIVADDDETAEAARSTDAEVKWRASHVLKDRVNKGGGAS